MTIRIRPWVGEMAPEILADLPGGQDLFLALAEKFLEALEKPDVAPSPAEGVDSPPCPPTGSTRSRS